MHPQPSYASLLGDRGLACSRPALHAAPRAEQAPHGLCPSEGLSGGTGAAPSLQTGEADLALDCPVWSFLQEAVVQTQEGPQGQDPQGLKKVIMPLLSCPAKKPSQKTD